MPGGNRKGPSGEGTMTGRGVGYCAGNNRPGYMSAGFGSRGFGYGNKNRWWQANRYSWQAVYSGLNKKTSGITNIEEEKALLKEQVGDLGKVLLEIKERLEALEKRGE